MVPCYIWAKNWNILFFPQLKLSSCISERLFLLVSVWCPIFCSSFKIRQIMQPHWLSLWMTWTHTHKKNVCPHCVRWVTNKAVILPFRDVGSIPPFYAIHKRRLCCTTTKPLRFPPFLYCQGQARFYWSVLKGSLAFSAGKKDVLWRGKLFPTTSHTSAVL